MTRTAGTVECTLVNRLVYLPSLTLKLSIPLLARCTSEEQDMVMLHEIAHLIDFVMRHKSDHSYLWQSVYRAIGGDGKQYHQISREGLEKTVRRFVWGRVSTGKVYIVKRGQHAKLVRSAGYSGTYEFLAEICVKGKELVERHDAQRAG